MSETKTITAEVENWLAAFQDALAACDGRALKSLFVAESYWRDVLSFTWGIDTVASADAIAESLSGSAPRVRPCGFEIDQRRTPPRRVTRAGTSAIEAIFRFETTEGRGSGVLRLVPEFSGGGALKAWTLLTALEEIKGHEERPGRWRPQGKVYSRDFHGPNWLDERMTSAAGMRTGILPFSWWGAGRPG